MRAHSPTKNCCCDRWRSRRKTFNFSFKIMISYFQTFFSPLAATTAGACKIISCTSVDAVFFLSLPYTKVISRIHTRWCQEQRNSDVGKKKRTTMCTCGYYDLWWHLHLNYFFSFCGYALRSFTYDIIPIIISRQLMRNGKDDVASAWEVLCNRSQVGKPFGVSLGKITILQLHTTI